MGPLEFTALIKAVHELIGSDARPTKKQWAKILECADRVESPTENEHIKSLEACVPILQQLSKGNLFEKLIENDGVVFDYLRRRVDKKDYSPAIDLLKSRFLKEENLQNESNSQSSKLSDTD